MQNALTLIIRPPSVDSAYTEWLNNEQPGRSDALDILLQLATLPGAQHVSLLLPACWFTCCHFTLPEHGFVPTQQAIAWQVEEQLISNSETLHWTVVGQKDGICYVLGVDRHKLMQLLDSYRHAGLTVTTVIPDGYYLPIQDAGWTALQLENGWLVRNSEYSWSYMRTALFSQLVQQFTPEVSLVCYGEPPDGLHADVYPVEPPLHFYTSTYSEAPLNLLHGEFLVKASAHPVSVPWRKRIFGCAVAAVLVYLATKGAIIWHLHQLQNAERLALQQSWQRYFPGNKHQGNYRFFFRQTVKSAAPDPLTRLRQLEKNLQSFPGIALSQFAANKETGELSLTVRASDFTTLEKFIEASSNTLDLSPPAPSANNIYPLKSGGH
jgi:type II secretion system protein L